MAIEITTVKDVPQLMLLIHSAYRGEGSKRGWTTEADILDGTRTSDELLAEIINSKDSVILKYTENGKIVGCVELEKVVKKGELKCYTGLLSVSPELQAKGIGKKLLKASEEWAKAEGCVALTMQVITVRTELIAWYKRHGFVEIGETEPFHSHNPVFGIPKQHLEFTVLDKYL